MTLLEIYWLSVLPSFIMRKPGKLIILKMENQNVKALTHLDVHKNNLSRKEKKNYGVYIRKLTILTVARIQGLESLCENFISF